MMSVPQDGALTASMPAAQVTGAEPNEASLDKAMPEERAATRMQANVRGRISRQQSSSKASERRMTAMLAPESSALLETTVDRVPPTKAVVTPSQPGGTIMWRPDLASSVDPADSPELLPVPPPVVAAAAEPKLAMQSSSRAWWADAACCGLRGRNGPAADDANAFNSTIMGNLLRHYRAMLAQAQRQPPSRREDLSARKNAAPRPID